MPSEERETLLAFQAAALVVSCCHLSEQPWLPVPRTDSPGNTLDLFLPVSSKCCSLCRVCSRLYTWGVHLQGGGRKLRPSSSPTQEPSVNPYKRVLVLCGLP
jgi:hypothetical protein